MNNGRGESGERRELYSVTLQWYSRDQSKTNTLNGNSCKMGILVKMKMGIPVKEAQPEVKLLAGCYRSSLMWKDRTNQCPEKKLHAFMGCDVI